MRFKNRHPYLKSVYKIKERDRPFLRSRTSDVTLQYLKDITPWREDIMNVVFEWHEQCLTSERNLYIIKRNTSWTTKTGKTIKFLVVYQVMWFLITTELFQTTTLSERSCGPAHCNSNSRCKPRLALLEEHVHVVRSSTLFSLYL